MIIEAEVSGKGVLDAGASSALSYGEKDESRRLMAIDVISMNTVQLNLIGGSVVGYNSSDPCAVNVRSPIQPS